MSVEQVDSLDAAMRLAMEHSYQVKGTTYPNPPVGAVIVDPEGRVVGVGATQPAGGDHAEVLALRRAGGLAAGGIAVVTLEPCNHYGKTPPCVNALIEARVGAVIYGVADPNAIAGGGAGRLQAAGVQVRSGLLADQVAAGPLREWLHKQRTGLPHVTWKYASSVAGGAAAVDAAGVLPCHVRQPGALLVQPLPQRSGGHLIGQQARTNLHARRLQPARAAARDRVGVGDAVDHGPHPGFDQCIHARRSLAVVVARLEGDHGDAAGRQAAGPPQGQDLGVVTARGLSGADADDSALLVH